MLKQLRYTTLLMLLTIVTFAQSHRFADSTAQWNVLETQYGFCTCISWQTNVYRVTGDTTLNSRNYQVVNFNSQSTQYPLQQNGYYYLRQDTIGKVYGLINADSAEYLIYDFSKQAGDSFITNLPLNWPGEIKVRIDSTAVMFEGLTRKTQYVTLTTSLGVLNDIFVEGIGAINGFFAAPGIEYTIYDGPDYNLLCFSEQANLVYHNPDYNTCTLDSTWMSISAPLTENTLQVYPNPASNVVSVTFSESNQQSLFTLTDLTGRAVLEQPLSAKQTLIDVTGIATGAYIYHIQNGNQPAYSGKLYKQ
jgi:hypothetical protein